MIKAVSHGEGKIRWVKEPYEIKSCMLRIFPKIKQNPKMAIQPSNELIMKEFTANLLQSEKSALVC